MVSIIYLYYAWKIKNAIKKCDRDGLLKYTKHFQEIPPKYTYWMYFKNFNLSHKWTKSQISTVMACFDYYTQKKNSLSLVLYFLCNYSASYNKFYTSVRWEATDILAYGAPIYTMQGDCIVFDPRVKKIIKDNVIDIFIGLSYLYNRGASMHYKLTSTVFHIWITLIYIIGTYRWSHSPSPRRIVYSFCKQRSDELLSEIRMFG